MIGSVLARLGEAWIACAVIQAVLWTIQQRTRNAGIVDVGWAASFTVIAGLFGLTALTPRSSFLPIALVVVVWSTRLAAHLVGRGAATGSEEGRYVTLRQRWALQASRKFFIFFQAQAALAALLSSAFVISFVSEPWDGGALRAIGMIVAIVGVGGEALSDAQLARWKRDPSNRGKVCDAGLWAYSRHPNYFFEWCVWIGYALYGLAFHGGWIAVLGQGVILASIFGVTGIPPTEAQAIQSKGEAYRRYQQRVSKFFPLPPKRTASS